MAAVTPLSVGPDGIGPLTFDTQPGLADGWSTAGWPGFNWSITSVGEMDAAANTNLAAYIATALPTDSNAVSPEGSSPLFRWNSARFFLESRPFGPAYSVLLLSLQNDSGIDRSVVRIEYDLGIDLTENAVEAEDPGLYGYRVYYSLTGAPGMWIEIPSLESPVTGGGAGHKSALITLPALWEDNAKLYFMWTDDNGVPGASDSTGDIEGPYTIDNIAVDFGVCKPPVIITPPHAVAVEACRSTNLTIAATGSHLNYQWFHDGTNIPGATRPILGFAKSSTADAGLYFCRITNCTDTIADSAQVEVIVNPDLDSPTVISAVALRDLKTYDVDFSELMDEAPFLNAGGAFFHIRPVGGGPDLGMITNALLLVGGTNVSLICDTPRLEAQNYVLVIDPSITDCYGNSITAREIIPETDQAVVSLAYEPRLTISLDRAGRVTLAWPVGTGAWLYATDANALAATNGWAYVAVPADGAYSVTPWPIGGQQKFYSLRKYR